ncbi:MAG: DHHA1 domain-containing protein, partial [Actinobacteria bacterium]|nr:DHHA1 domain-containing protein [Actinomycetota bacterium]
IEAVCGRSAVSYYRERDQLVKDAVEKLGVADDQLLPGIDKVQARLTRAEQELKKFMTESARDVVQSLVEAAQAHDGVSVIAGVVEARDMDHLLALVDQVRDRAQPAVVALGAAVNGKAALVVSVSKEVEHVDAGRIVRESSRMFGGGGGGTAQLGRGGGGDPARLKEAVEAVREAVVGALAG